MEMVFNIIEVIMLLSMVIFFILPIALAGIMVGMSLIYEAVRGKVKEKQEMRRVLGK